MPPIIQMFVLLTAGQQGVEGAKPRLALVTFFRGGQKEALRCDVDREASGQHRLADYA